MATMGNERKLAPAKVARLVEQAADGTDVVIDLTDVWFIDSVGLSALLAAHRQIIKNGGIGLILKHPHSAVRKVLAFTRLDKVFRIVEDPSRLDETKNECGEIEGALTFLSRPPLHCSFPALKSLIPKSIEMARKYLQEANIGNELLDQLDIVLSEAITNAVVHGGKNNERALVTLNVEVIGRQIRFIVGDDGGGFDPDAVPEPDFSGEELGGRGVFIMRSIMDDIRYEKRPEGALNLLFLELTMKEEDE